MITIPYWFFLFLCFFAGAGLNAFYRTIREIF